MAYFYAHFTRPNRLNAKANATQDVSSASITHAFACTYIDLAHNATACIQELHRVIAPGGILGINTCRPYPPEHLDSVEQSLPESAPRVQSTLGHKPEMVDCGTDQGKSGKGRVQGRADEAGHDALEMGKSG